MQIRPGSFSALACSVTVIHKTFIIRINTLISILYCVFWLYVQEAKTRLNTAGSKVNFAGEKVRLEADLHVLEKVGQSNVCKMHYLHKENYFNLAKETWGQILKRCLIRDEIQGLKIRICTEKPKSGPTCLRSEAVCNCSGAVQC
jgi:hypothetical protein